MFFVELFAAASMVNFAIWTLIIVATCTSVAYDQRNETYWRWFIVFAAFGAFVSMSGVGLSPSTWLEALSSVFSNREVWTGIGVYFGLGILYSGAEFAMSVRRAATRLKNTWANFLDNKETVKSLETRVVRRDLYDDVKNLGDESAYLSVVRDMNVSFVNKNQIEFNRDVIRIQVTADGKDIEPVVNRSTLPGAVGDWVTFWPFFLLNFVLYDMLAELWSVIASFLANYSQRFVKVVFSDVFKIH